MESTPSMGHKKLEKVQRRATKIIQGYVSRYRISYQHRQYAIYDSSSLEDNNDFSLPLAASFNLFEPAAEAEITTLIQASENKQCYLDSIPISLLKECTHLVPFITKSSIYL